MFFGKKKRVDKPADEAAEESTDDPNAEPEVPVAPPQQASDAGGDASLGRLTADIEKLKAQFSTFYELQKTTSERFSRINEQIGELRSMMIERDKSTQHLEAKAVQAIDLVKTVQPDKLMIEMRKGDSKIEALRANLESNENIINNIVTELKDTKNRINVFRGMEQVITLNDEAKKELLEVKKVQAMVERHADKVETIFTEMQKKFSDFVRFSDTVKDLDKAFKQISSEFDSMKIKITDLSSKKEVENLITKFEDFEKYTGNLVRLMNNRFEKMQAELNSELGKKFEDMTKLLHGFEMLAQKTPDLDKYFNLLQEEARKAPKDSVKVEKIKTIGEEQKDPVQAATGSGMFGKVTGLFRK